MRNLRSPLAFASVATLSLLVGDAIAATPMPMQTVEIVAEGMCCQGCARKVSGKLYAARGVRSVATDVPTHAVTVQAPRAGEAYLGTLWDAVSASDGSPTSLSTSDATFRLEPADAPTAQNNSTAIRIKGLDSGVRVQRLVGLFSAVDGVAGAQFDPNSASLLVTTAQGRRLNPWAAVEIAVRAGERPVSVADSTGTLTIEWRDALTAESRNANLLPNGEVNR